MKTIAKSLLDINAVFLSPNKPFTWASGIISPIYCDNRLIISNVKARKYVEQALATLIDKQYPDAEVIVGTATAGIAHSAIVSHLLDKPCAYVRAKQKDHGRQNLVEGFIPDNACVVVVEDLISTGQSSIAVCATLKALGFNVLGVVSIFNYGMQSAIDNFKKINISKHSLVNIDTLLSVAIEENYITTAEREKIKKFIANPDDDSWQTL